MDSALVEAMLNLLEVYERRRDLQEAFPEVMIKDYRRLLEWACGTTKKRWEDCNYNILKPYEKQFESLLSIEEISDPSIDKWFRRARAPTLSLASFYNLLREVSYVHNSTFSWGPPKIYNIETTSYCPSKCITCPKKYMFTRKPEHMSLDLFNQIVKQIRPEYQVDPRTGLPEIGLFHFGEPCWHPYFSESIKICKRQGLYVTISDSAAQFTPDCARKAIESSLDEVILIQDGMDDETSMSIRGNNASFGKGVENVKALIDLKHRYHVDHPTVTIAMIRQPANRHQWDQFNDYWRNFDGIHAELVGFSNFAGNVPEINELLRKLQQMGGQSEEDRRVSQLNSYRCFYPWYSVSILSDGKVVPCCRDMNGMYILGDLKHKTLRQIWNDKPIRNLRREWINGNVKNPLCSSCTEANSEIGLPNRFYPGFDVINRVFPSFYKRKKYAQHVLANARQIS